MKYVWIRDGIIRIRVNDSSLTVRIDKLSQLELTPEKVCPDSDPDPEKTNTNPAAKTPITSLKQK